MSDKPLADLRKDYERGELDESMAAEVPLEQFREWLDAAVSGGLPDPNAMTVATVGTDGRPSTRVVLLKGFDERGLVWYTNYQSRKGRQLAGNPFAALQFHWVEFERVVRIEGRVEFSDPVEADAYYASRPLASRIGAWASAQSEELGSRLELVKRTAEMGLKLGLNPPRPPHWGGYQLVPDYWEFWQGRRSRLHDRICYRLEPDGRWVRRRLSP